MSRGEYGVEFCMEDWVELELWNGWGRVADCGSSGGGKESRCGGGVRVEAAVCLCCGSRRYTRLDLRKRDRMRGWNFVPFASASL
jgi:hypothetical protein